MADQVHEQVADRAAERRVQAVADGSTDAISVPTVTATVRYFAAARAAAGVSEELLTVPGTVGALLDLAAERHGPELARVLQRCSFLLDEIAVHGRATPLGDGQVLDVLPPFAGG